MELDVLVSGQVDLLDIAEKIAEGDSFLQACFLNYLFEHMEKLCETEFAYVAQLNSISESLEEVSKESIKILRDCL